MAELPQTIPPRFKQNLSKATLCLMSSFFLVQTKWKISVAFSLHTEHVGFSCQSWKDRFLKTVKLDRTQRTEDDICPQLPPPSSTSHFIPSFESLTLKERKDLRRKGGRHRRREERSEWKWASLEAPVEWTGKPCYWLYRGSGALVWREN